MIIAFDSNWQLQIHLGSTWQRKSRLTSTEASCALFDPRQVQRAKVNKFLSAIDGERFSHGALDVQSLDLSCSQCESLVTKVWSQCNASSKACGVVPILLQQGHQKVDCHEAVLPVGWVGWGSRSIRYGGSVSLPHLSHLSFLRMSFASLASTHQVTCQRCLRLRPCKAPSSTGTSPATS